MKGAVDQKGYEEVIKSARQTQETFNAGNYEKATDLWSRTQRVIMRVTHKIDFYNILKEIPNTDTKKHISTKIM